MFDLRLLAGALAAGVVSSAPGCQAPIDDAELVRPAACAEQGRKACEAACDRNDGAACLAASIAYRTRRAKMMALQRRACELGEAQGCTLYANNFKRGDAADPALALEYSKRGCTLGSGRSCVWLARRALKPAEDARRIGDVVRAREAWVAACRSDPAMCGGLADFEVAGLGGARDREAAVAHYREACDSGKAAPACLNLEPDHDPSRVWMHLANWGVVEIIAQPTVHLQLQGALPGQVFGAYVGVCFQEGSFAPVHAAAIEASEVPDFDAAIVDTVSLWRGRPREPFPAELAACFPIRFEAQADQHINVDFGF